MYDVDIIITVVVYNHFYFGHCTKAHALQLFMSQ